MKCKFSCEILTTKTNRMAHKKIILRLLELAQELDKAEKQIECSMIVNDMEKLIDSYITKQLNLHSVVNPVCPNCMSEMHEEKHRVYKCTNCSTEY